MNHDQEDQSGTKSEDSPADSFTAEDKDWRREPVFSEFEEDDDYEEPDRDTDYASAYGEDNIDEEESLFPDDDLFQDDDPLTEEDDFQDENLASTDNPLADEQDEEGSAALSIGKAGVATANWYEPDSEPEAWMDEEEYPEEDEAIGQPWPMGLIAVALLALVLLIAGGYGVMQQRAATQEEVRQLRAALATAASPEDVGASRNALQQLQEHNATLSASVESLTRDNRRLTDTVAGLEAQLDAQQAALAKQVAAAAKETKPVAPKPVAAKPVPAKPEPAAVPAPTPAPAKPSSGNWFVNFGSYGQQAVARSWSSKLRPGSGSVVVSAAEKDGKTFYRVRVVGLTDEKAARAVAQQLESDYGLSRLWVGKQ